MSKLSDTDLIRAVADRFPMTHRSLFLLKETPAILLPWFARGYSYDEAYSIFVDWMDYRSLVLNNGFYTEAEFKDRLFALALYIFSDGFLETERRNMVTLWVRGNSKYLTVQESVEYFDKEDDTDPWANCPVGCCDGNWEENE